jgi:hypothetical protein
MEYAVDIGLGAMIHVYVPSLIKIGSGIQNIIGWIQRHGRHKDAQTHIQHGDRISVL